jgi:hypothetical protein
MINRKVYDLAHKFRNALEIMQKEHLYGRSQLFQSFPKGCCTYASDLLAEYLQDNGVPVKFIESREMSKAHFSHCWIILEDSTIVDITADQFNRNIYFRDFGPIPKCIVESSEYPLYSLFDRKIDKSVNYGIKSYSNECIQQQLRDIYNIVIRIIDEVFPC